MSIYSDEHSLLSTFLIRAAGIESNVVLCLIYVPKQQGFLYHTWVVVYDENKSHNFTDPSLNIFPPKNRPIPLVIDSESKRHMYIFELINNLEILYMHLQ